VDQDTIDGMMSEIEMMSRLRHPNIIQFLACVFEPYVCLVLEFATKGSLRALLDANKSGFEFKWREHASMVLDTARAINYLHSAFTPAIVHRDIKPDNVRRDSLPSHTRRAHCQHLTLDLCQIGARERGVCGQAR
jgi:serine/threonine protein kinase